MFFKWENHHIFAVLLLLKYIIMKKVITKNILVVLLFGMLTSSVVGNNFENMNREIPLIFIKIILGKLSMKNLEIFTVTRLKILILATLKMDTIP